MNITIKLTPITKKNSQQIVQVHGRPLILPSQKYRQYEKACAVFMPKLKEPINEPVNIRCVFYMPTRRKVDLTNLLSCAMDILVRYQVITDDCRDIAYANDGSRVYYDKSAPRTEIEITRITDENVERWSKE